MSSHIAIIGISFLFSIMFIPVYGVGSGVDDATFAGLEIVNELEYYTLNDSMTVRGKTPTNESLDITLDIKHFESGDILKTFETKSNEGRYSVDFSISDIFTNDSPSGKYQVILTYGDRTPEINSFQFDSSVNEPKIPDWIKTNAGWWADGSIDDSSFVQGIQFLIKEDILKIPPTTSGSSSDSDEVPEWIKTNAGWWADGSIDDSSFVQGIQFLIKEGILKI
jgi:hypothetical protein